MNLNKVERVVYVINKARFIKALTEKMVAATFIKNKAEQSSLEYLKADEQIKLLAEIIELAGAAEMLVQQDKKQASKQKEKDSGSNEGSLTALSETIAESVHEALKRKQKEKDKMFKEFVRKGEIEAAVGLIFSEY